MSSEIERRADSRVRSIPLLILYSILTSRSIIIALQAFLHPRLAPSPVFRTKESFKPFELRSSLGILRMWELPSTWLLSCRQASEDSSLVASSIFGCATRLICP